MYKVVNSIDNSTYGKYETYLEAQEICAELNDFDNSWEWEVEKD